MLPWPGSVIATEALGPTKLKICAWLFTEKVFQLLVELLISDELLGNRVTLGKSLSLSVLLVSAIRSSPCQLQGVRKVQ